MGGFFGITSTENCILDVFFGVDYHSHLGTRRGGLASYDKKFGFQREIHNIENAPFRTKFEGIVDKMSGQSAIGCISDMDPQPLLFRSVSGTYAICFVGVINNVKEIADLVLKGSHGHFEAMTAGRLNQAEIIAALISDKDDLVEGIRHAQEIIDGSASILVLKEGGDIIVARDKDGRIPVTVGISENASGVSFETFPLEKAGFENIRDLGPGEIVELKPGKCKQLRAPDEEMKICAFLWSYYGYPTTTYEGVNVETMRYKNGRIMARNDRESGFDLESVDYVGGVPDSLQHLLRGPHRRWSWCTWRGAREPGEEAGHH